MKYLLVSLFLLSATLCNAENVAWTVELHQGDTLVSMPRTVSEAHTPVTICSMAQIPIQQTQGIKSVVKHYDVGYTVTLQAFMDNRFYAKVTVTDSDLRSNSYEATSNDTIHFKLPARSMKEDRHFLFVHWQHEKTLEAREFVVHPPVSIAL